jgi:hypothetical protein
MEKIAGTEWVKIPSHYNSLFSSNGARPLEGNMEGNRDPGISASKNVGKFGRTHTHKKANLDPFLFYAVREWIRDHSDVVFPRKKRGYHKAANYPLSFMPYEAGQRGTKYIIMPLGDSCGEENQTPLNVQENQSLRSHSPEASTAVREAEQNWLRN